MIVIKIENKFVFKKDNGIMNKNNVYLIMYVFVGFVFLSGFWGCSQKDETMKKESIRDNEASNGTTVNDVDDKERSYNHKTDVAAFFESFVKNPNISGAPVISVDGRAALGVEDYKVYLNNAFQSEPQLAISASVMPNFYEEFGQGIMYSVAAIEWALKNGILKQDHVQNMLGQAFRMMISEFSLNEFMKTLSLDEPSDNNLKEYYKAKKASFLREPAAVKCIILDFDDEKKAQEFYGTVKHANKAEFMKKAKDMNVTSREESISARTNHDSAIKKFATSVQKTPAVQVVKNKNKYSVLLAFEKSEAEYVPFDELKDRLKGMFVEEQKQLKAPAALAKLAKEMKVTIDTTVFKDLPKLGNALSDNDKKQLEAFMQAQQQHGNGSGDGEELDLSSLNEDFLKSLDDDSSDVADKTMKKA